MSLLLAIALAVPSAPSGFDHTHALWTEILSDHVRGEGVDYKRLKADSAKLDQYLASLEAVQPEEFAAWRVQEKLAYWIDAYNAFTIRHALDVYPIASLKDVEKGGDQPFWDQEFVPLGKLFPEAGDRKLSLNDVQNRILRPKFKDARVHAALCCGARGSPLLQPEAFVAEKLERQLDGRVEKWLADAGRNRYERDGKRLRLSRIFEWYRDDFARDGGSVKDWVGARAPAAEREWIAQTPELEIAFLDYSWELNDAK